MFRSVCYWALASGSLGVVGCATAEGPRQQQDAQVRLDAGRDGALDGRRDAPLPIDARSVDAPPDACVPRLRQLLVNGNFDSAPVGVGWTQRPSNAAFPIVTVPPSGIATASAPNLAWLGGAANAVDEMWQDVVVPIGATNLEVLGKRMIGTQELFPLAADTLTIALRDTNNNLLATIVSLSNEDESEAYVPFAFPLANSHAGQTLRVHVRSQTDGSWNTNFFIEDLAVNVMACP